MATVPSANTANRADGADVSGRAASAETATKRRRPRGLLRDRAPGESWFELGCANNATSPALQPGGYYRDRDTEAAGV